MQASIHQRATLGRFQTNSDLNCPIWFTLMKARLQCLWKAMRNAACTIQVLAFLGSEHQSNPQSNSLIPCMNEAVVCTSTKSTLPYTINALEKKSLPWALKLHLNLIGSASSSQFFSLSEGLIMAIIMIMHKYLFFFGGGGLATCSVTVLQAYKIQLVYLLGQWFKTDLLEVSGIKSVDL